MFSDGASIEVEPVAKKTGPRPLSVRYRDHHVTLDPNRPGALNESDNEKVEAFRQGFFTATSDIKLEYIDTRRLIGLHDSKRAEALKQDPRLVHSQQYLSVADWSQLNLLLDPSVSTVRDVVNPKALREEASVALSDRITRFIADAQVNYRQFFAAQAPDMFARLLETAATSQGRFEIDDLSRRVGILGSEDSQVAHLGLEPVLSGVDQLRSVLAQAKKQMGSESLLTMVGAYLEMLESRAAERQLLADRLLRFENLMNQFFEGKTVQVNAKSGLVITSRVGRTLTEYQLSSGEFHLLYLMVSALIVRRTGTVMAIDEPEMSMHLAWQRRLVKALSACATGAEPQFILATHSPDVAAEYAQSMVELSPFD